MKKLFKQLFCNHKFKYTKINEFELSIPNYDGKRYCRTFAVCQYCGKEKGGYIYV